VPDVPDGPGGTVLITKRETPGQLTLRRDTDARTALTRGLKEYLETLAIDASTGRRHAFRKVSSTWAEPEQSAQYPSAVILADGPGAYDASKFTPSVIHRFDIPEKLGLVQAAEFNIDLTVDVWATDPKERVGLAMLLEDALNPITNWMYGFALELPHYHSARGVYELISQTYSDTEVDAMRRYRRALYIVKAHVPVYRTTRLPDFMPKAIVEVTKSELQE
jgi:hypothetical protein